MFEELKKVDNRYVIDYFQHGIFNNPNKSITKKYNLRFKIGNDFYYFKGNGFFSYDKSELFCDQIAKQVGLRSINPVPAYLINDEGKYIEGILSKDYVKNRESTEIINGNQLLKFYVKSLVGDKLDINLFYKEKVTKEDAIALRKYNNLQSYRSAILHFKKSLEQFKSGCKLETDKNFMADLSKYLILYFVTCNEDCYAHNIEIVIEKSRENTIELSLAPLTDNSISLLLKSFKFDYKNLSSEIDDKKLNDVIKTVVDEIRMPFKVFESDAIKFNRDSVAIEIARLISKSPKLKEFYTQLKSINLDELLHKYKTNNGYEFINELDIKIASKTYSYAISQLEKGLEYCALFFPQQKTQVSKSSLQKE